jgi:hypothetical protein
MIQIILEWIRRHWRNSPEATARYRVALDQNEAMEDSLVATLHQAAYGGGPRSPLAAQAVTAAILSVRERRVDILRDLGWTESADQLAADTAMRREWLTEPPYQLNETRPS